MKQNALRCSSLWVAAVFLLAPGALQATNVALFNAAKAYPAGNNPVSAAVGDFNRDGRPDLAVANYNDGTVSILPGDGTGAFIHAVNVPVGQNPNSVVTDDFNGDGKPDLAVANEGLYTVSILLGNGDGSFQPGVSYPTSVDSGFVVVGDFNGDGKPDLIVSGARSAAIAVLLGNGDGSFQAPVVTSIGFSNAWVAVADFNGDGKADVAAVEHDQVGGGFSIMLGKGDGSFQSATNFAVGLDTQAVVTGDFNGDGNADVAVATCCLSSTGLIWTVLGNGDGSFQQPFNFEVEGAYLLATADFDGDGKPDLAVAAGATAVGVTILFGRGDGNFRQVVSRPMGGPLASLNVGDFNADGRPDVAAVMPDFNDVSVLLSPFRKPNRFSTAGGMPQALATGDFNGDGIADLAVANFGCNCNPPRAGTVAILLGNGDGTFRAAVIYAAGKGPKSVAAGDFNGDGKLDLAVAGYAGISVLLGNGDGTFQSQVGYMPGTSTDWVAVGDFNGDGHLDLAVASMASSSVSILIGNGDGAFRLPLTQTLHDQPTFLTVADINRDGKADLAVAAGGIFVLLGNGDGTFLPPFHYSTPGGSLSIAVSDLNGDGNPDLVAGGRQGVSILLGTGTGAMRPSVNYTLPSGAVSLALADFSGDGKPDLATVGFTGFCCYSWQVSILLGAGNVVFTEQPIRFVAGDNPAFGTSVIAGDFNGDGKPDLAVLGEDTDSVTILTNITP